MYIYIYITYIYHYYTGKDVRLHSHKEYMLNTIKEQRILIFTLYSYVMKFLYSYHESIWNLCLNT